VTEGPVGDTSAAGRTDLVDELRDLAAQRDAGLLTEVEFQRARAAAVARLAAAPPDRQPAR
jgi:hypothetical protein